ncbi:MAG: transcription antitermination factor NusB [Defluviitaleaceae bacterium]|nr:transcription antitermination factor NusB [Defluviitaleaceae bacterium]
MGRKASRRHAFSIIYQIPFRGKEFDARTAAEEYIADEEISEADAGFMRELVDGTVSHLSEINRLISELAEWAFDRIATADLAILRLAIFEILYSGGEVPVSVAINEAVELAKAYGTDDSGVFVNGLLARVAKRAEANG